MKIHIGMVNKSIMASIIWIRSASLFYSSFQLNQTHSLRYHLPDGYSAHGSCWLTWLGIASHLSLSGIVPASLYIPFASVKVWWFRTSSDFVMHRTATSAPSKFSVWMQLLRGTYSPRLSSSMTTSDSFLMLNSVHILSGRSGWTNLSLGLLITSTDTRFQWRKPHLLVLGSALFEKRLGKRWNWCRHSLWITGAITAKGRIKDATWTSGQGQRLALVGLVLGAPMATQKFLDNKAEIEVSKEDMHASKTDMHARGEYGKENGYKNEEKWDGNGYAWKRGWLKMMGKRVRWIGESNGFENRYDGIYIKERKNGCG